jgi:FkbM family methyltransferase
MPPSATSDDPYAAGPACDRLATPLWDLTRLRQSFLIAAEMATNPAAIAAWISWPRFSITSFRLVSGLVRQGLTARTVLDVGANTGQFAVAAAKLLPGARVYSFEPLPQCLAQLRRHTNKLPNVTIYPVALGDREADDLLFHINSHSQSSSALHIAEAHRAAFPHERETGSTIVKVSTLDRIFESVGLASPVLLKLDVQGYEAKVLLGGVETLKRVDYVVLEASLRPMYEGEALFLDLVRLMHGYGFRFLRPVGWLADPKTDEVLQMDILFAKAI